MRHLWNLYYCEWCLLISHLIIYSIYNILFSLSLVNSTIFFFFILFYLLTNKSNIISWRIRIFMNIKNQNTFNLMMNLYFYFYQTTIESLITLKKLSSYKWLILFNIPFCWLQYYEINNLISDLILINNVACNLIAFITMTCYSLLFFPYISLICKEMSDIATCDFYNLHILTATYLLYQRQK